MGINVVIVGSPNVGKSTLFNCLVGKRLAIVDKVAGVTRDRREGEAQLGDLVFKVVDTAGFDQVKTNLLCAMQRQMWQAIRLADILLFVIDARLGITTADSVFAALLHKSGKHVVLVANKTETSRGTVVMPYVYSLGFGAPILISAEHKEGLAGLYTVISSYIKSNTSVGTCNNETTEQLPPLKVCIVGRPNTGKSTLINTLVSEERLLVGPEAGITRDAISIKWCWQGMSIILFDTAGLRRSSNVQEKLEKLAVSDTLEAMQFADIVIVCMDVNTPFEKQDLQIADLVIYEGRGLVIAINKWDLVENKHTVKRELQYDCRRLLPQIRGVPLVYTSGLTGEGIHQLMLAVVRGYKFWNKRVSTARLNAWLESAMKRHPIPVSSKRGAKIRYVTQIKKRPPHFTLFASRPHKIPGSYLRYLQNDLRKELYFPGVPIRLSLRSGGNPYR